MLQSQLKAPLSIFNPPYKALTPPIPPPPRGKEWDRDYWLGNYRKYPLWWLVRYKARQYGVNDGLPTDVRQENTAKLDVRKIVANHHTMDGDIPLDWAHITLREKADMVQELTKGYPGLAKFEDDWAAIRILKARIKNARTAYMAIAKKAEDEEADKENRWGCALQISHESFGIKYRDNDPDLADHEKVDQGKSCPILNSY